MARSIAVRDDEAFRFYYDYLTLFVLAVSTDDAALSADLDDRSSRRHTDGLPPATSAPRRNGSASNSPVRRRVEFVCQRDRPRSPRHGVGVADPASIKRKAAAHLREGRSNSIARDDGLRVRHEPAAAAAGDEGKCHPRCSRGSRMPAAGLQSSCSGRSGWSFDTNLPSGSPLFARRWSAGGSWRRVRPLDDDLRGLLAARHRSGTAAPAADPARCGGMDQVPDHKTRGTGVNAFPHRTLHWEGSTARPCSCTCPRKATTTAVPPRTACWACLDRYPERDSGSALLVYGAWRRRGGPARCTPELLARNGRWRGLPRGDLHGIRLLPALWKAP